MIKLRHTRRGWFYLWVEFLSGTVSFRTGATFPDKDGCLKRRVFVGPFATAVEAVNRAQATAEEGLE